MDNPYQELLTPYPTVSEIQSTRQQNNCQKSKVVPRPPNVPPRTTKASLLGGLLHKMDVGACALMVEQELQTRHSNARLSTNSGNVTRSNSANQRTFGGTLRKCTTEKAHERMSKSVSTGNNQSSNPKPTPSNPIRKCANNTANPRRSAQGRARSSSTSPRARRRRSEPPPFIALQSPLERPATPQQPNLNPAKWKRQISRSNRHGVAPERAERPQAHFPLSLKQPKPQHVDDAPLSGRVQKPPRKTASARKPTRKTTTPSSPKPASKIKDQNTGNVKDGNFVRYISGQVANEGKIYERTDVIKPSTVSQPVARTMLHGTEINDISKRPSDAHVRRNRTVQEAAENRLKRQRNKSKEPISPRVMHPTPLRKSASPQPRTPTTAVAGHQDSKRAEVASVAVASQPVERRLHKSASPNDLNKNEKTDAVTAVQEPGLCKQVFARPIKKRRLLTERSIPGSRVTDATAVAMKDVGVLDLAEVTASGNSTKAQSEEVIESPVCVTEAPFAVEALDLRKRRKEGKTVENQAANENHGGNEISKEVKISVETRTRCAQKPQRCLSFERRQQKTSANLYIADPREEYTTNIALRAVYLNDENSSVRSTLVARLSNSQDWEITFS